MEVFNSRIPHLAEQIFEQLDSKSIRNCREVAKSWQKHIDEKNLPWLRVINVPAVPQNGDTYLHVAAKYGQTEMFEILLENEEVKNPENDKHETPLHLACRNKHSKIAELLLQQSTEFDKDVNSKDILGLTAFHYAYINGQSMIADMIKKKSVELLSLIHI